MVQAKLCPDLVDLLQHHNQPIDPNLLRLADAYKTAAEFMHELKTADVEGVGTDEEPGGREDKGFGNEHGDVSEDHDSSSVDPDSDETEDGKAIARRKEAAISDEALLGQLAAKLAGKKGKRKKKKRKQQS